jgi:hypothetical protein
VRSGAAVRPFFVFGFTFSLRSWTCLDWVIWTYLNA